MGSASQTPRRMHPGLPLLVLVSALLVTWATAQDVYDYQAYQLDPAEAEEVVKRAWNSQFSSGMGKRAWTSGFNGGMGKRANNNYFSGGLAKRAWNSGFSSGMGKRSWTSGFTGGMGKRATPLYQGS